jgi:hypothetical protein
LFCFIGETRDFLWGRFRPGNRYSRQEAKGFLRECLKILPQRIKNIRARGDSSFSHGAFLEEMEKQGIEYALAAKLYAPSQYLLGGLDYRDIGDGIAVGEFGYQGSWEKERRMVVIREAIKEGQKKVKRMAKWIRQRFFLIAGKLVRRGRRWILNLPRNWPWQGEYRQAERRLDAPGFP